jgi:hypothetical protein
VHPLGITVVLDHAFTGISAIQSKDKVTPGDFRFKLPFMAKCH